MIVVEINAFECIHKICVFIVVVMPTLLCIWGGTINTCEHMPVYESTGGLHPWFATFHSEQFFESTEVFVVLNPCLPTCFSKLRVSRNNILGLNSSGTIEEMI
jgi:hypothetical protein